ncbi:MAG TPA: sulfatase [Verrucomicrobiales bacterium]|nr:sulfatase [Verrucomicrobiales bacterium]
MNIKNIFVSLIVLTHCTVFSQTAERPNFVFILGEAQGWSSLSAQMDRKDPRSKNDSFHTPNLNKLANEGMRFSRFYAPSPRCTPSRAAFFTGKSPAQLHMTFVNTGNSGGRVSMPKISTELALSEITIAERLKTVGYATAHFGKWHVGRKHPSRHGFDESDGATSNSGPENVSNPNPEQYYKTAASGIDFIARQAKEGRPFYLQVSHYSGRSAEHAKPGTLEIMRDRLPGKDTRQLGSAAAALDADLSIGLILNALNSLNIADNTYVFYTADHGAQGRNGPLSNGKGSVKEGGIRVPLIVRGPGIQPGSFAEMVASGVDLFPTLSDLAGIQSPLPPGVEGGSLAESLKNRGEGTVKRAREEFIVHFPHDDKDPLGPASSLLLDGYKLIRYYQTGNSQLFNLEKDLGEQTNLAGQMPEKVTELETRLTTYLQEVNAQIPVIDETRSADAGTTVRGRQRGGGNRPDSIFQALDRDGDGLISSREINNASTVLRSFDQDGDGKLTQDEIRRNGRRGRGGQRGNREGRSR